MTTRQKDETLVSVPGIGQMKIRPASVNRIEVEFEDMDPALFERDEEGWRPGWNRRTPWSMSRSEKQKDWTIASTLNEWTVTHRDVYQRLVLERLEGQTIFGDFMSNFEDLNIGGIETGEAALADVAPFLSIMATRMLEDRLEATREFQCTIHGADAEKYQRVLRAVTAAADQLLQWKDRESVRNRSIETP